MPSTPQAEAAYERDTHRTKRLICAACGQLVTTESAAIAVNEHHKHTFLNPAGMVFTIGCFAAAEGALPDGPSSDHWTWFPGFAWQAALCRGCSTLLGWLFRSTAQSFFGLILDRLAEAEDR